MPARTTRPAEPATTHDDIVELVPAGEPAVELAQLLADVTARIVEEPYGFDVTVTFDGPVDTDRVIALQARCRSAGFACSGVQIIAASVAYWRAESPAPILNTDDQEV